MEIKIAEEKDVPIVYQLMLEAFEEYRFLEVPSSALNESLDALQNTIKSHTEQAIVCTVNEVPVGSCRFKLKEDALYFSRLSVATKARGKGVAKAMLGWLEEHAKKNLKAKIECRVRASLPKNIRLYESLGYFTSNVTVITNPNGISVKTVFIEKTLVD
ncbi:GNAT family N-acetyltransferase [Bacillus sp. BRMEA1]|uniref:GNAT family N-acetyltransferase n=1 Tax=Neobacillus endophyticus TaxID=2738405 RepID=UPI001563AC3A|nr:GNAT family N-acetyltransferase [Neobacillus endophyticus]NRD77865.1 GNAT family N-acetyltransferase [Neobacillus endophyticus]